MKIQVFEHWVVFAAAGMELTAQLLNLMAAN